MTLMAQIFNQVQDIVTIASFAVGLVVYAPWLILLLAVGLIPSFIGEAHFNSQSYWLNYHRAPERRELDYVRQTAASVETAKEVKIFNLNPFLIERYGTLAESFFQENKRLAVRRAGWGGLLATVAPSPTTSPMRTSSGTPSRATSPSATSPSSRAPSGACTR
jgi:ATP-binding cassette subfamily B protein